MTIYFCVNSEDDPVIPVLKRLLSDFPAFDARIFIESEDPQLAGENINHLGPNPKIRNMSRAYREAKGDIIWVMDCNVWVNKGTCGRMVDRLFGYGSHRPNKFVHQLPLVVDQSSLRQWISAPNRKASELYWNIGGGRMEEAWFHAAHSKFYTAINTVLIAPCIVGKSNMFRKSHLNALTDGLGVDYFSYNICEDHLIGDLLWKRPVPLSVLNAADKILPGSLKHTWGNHALDFGDLAIQPVRNMTIEEFVSRRVRWLRVRKFTVILATFVEPGTESILCSIYGAYAITSLPYFSKAWAIPPTWTAFWMVWLLSMTIWASVDFVLYRFLGSGLSIEFDEHTPEFAQFRHNPRHIRRSFKPWFSAWLGRELMAFPIWAWAVYGGVTVSWRGKRFRVGTDMKVREIREILQSGPIGAVKSAIDSKSRIE